MAREVDFADLLERAPTRRMRRRLVRCVPALDFLEGDPPSFLYTSGRANRCNPQGVECLYFSETERVATLEYRRMLGASRAASAPKLTFIADVDLLHVIDLEKANVLSALALSVHDIFEPWRIAVAATKMQRLGLAINGQRIVSAIRYPSETGRRAGAKGCNVAIFLASIATPSRVHILGTGDTVLQELP